MHKLIKVVGVNKNSVEIWVCAAIITFVMIDGKIQITRMPPPRECHIPKHIMDFAKKKAKEEIEKERERLRLESLQKKLPY